MVPGPLQGPAGSLKTPPLCSGLTSAALLLVEVPTRQPMRDKGALSPFQPPPTLAGFLPSHPPLTHSRNKGRAGAAPLPGGADYLILYPAITASRGRHYPRKACPPPCPRDSGMFMVGVPIHSAEPPRGQAGPDLAFRKWALQWGHSARPTAPPTASPQILDS